MARLFEGVYKLCYMFNKDLLNEIGQILKKQKQSVAVAESVTSGLLQAAFSNAKDASAFFQGGVTAYNVGQKCRHLLVEPLHALECDSVSENVARDMSLHVCTLFTSDYGISVTGYAARMPEKNVNSLYAFYAITEKNKIVMCGKMETNVEEGLPAQLFYMNEVLKIFKNYLKNKSIKVPQNNTILS
jgi:nicotinamide-nucleotide amidase